MAVRHSFLALPDDFRAVVAWFEALPDDVTVSDNAERTVLYFRNMALRTLELDGKIDQEKTPLVFLKKPQLRRGTLWTDSEAEFSASPLREQFPELHEISLSFKRWLEEFELVFSQKAPNQSEWSYYLEGGIQNYDEKLYALPKAMAALRKGQYFIHHRSTDGSLDVLARNLKLRGYHVEAA